MGLLSPIRQPGGQIQLKFIIFLPLALEIAFFRYHSTKTFHQISSNTVSNSSLYLKEKCRVDQRRFPALSATKVGTKTSRKWVDSQVRKTQKSVKYLFLIFLTAFRAYIGFVAQPFENSTDLYKNQSVSGTPQ